MQVKTIKPTGTNLFAKPAEKETTTASGFILTESQVEAPKWATVINVGPRVTDIAPGDVIVYKSYAASDLVLEKTDYILIAEDDIQGVMVETADAS